MRLFYTSYTFVNGTRVQTCVVLSLSLLLLQGGNPSWIFDTYNALCIHVTLLLFRIGIPRKPFENRICLVVPREGGGSIIEYNRGREILMMRFKVEASLRIRNIPLSANFQRINFTLTLVKVFGQTIDPRESLSRLVTFTETYWL